MYRLTLYYLIFLVAVAIVLSRFGLVNTNPADLVISSLIATGVCFVANYVFAKLFNAVTNVESVFITALILTLIIPTSLPGNLTFIIIASVLAMAAKYLLTVEKRHLFNPAAVSVLAISLISPEHAATWWIGTPAMLPFVLVGGLLLLRKIRREDMVFIFLIVYLAVIGIGSLISSTSVSTVVTILQISILHSAVFFFAFVMLTEPLTSPSTERLRGFYAGFIAILYSTPMLRFISVGLTPEMALCIGNVFSYIISPNYRLGLFLNKKLQLSQDTYSFVFNKQKNFRFLPGQYMEWTLPHKNADSRGVRRYFSISSSPTEENLEMTVKFYDPSSSYKKELITLSSKKQIVAAQVAGDFTLPENLKTPLVFIAGGVGIAPFRSMIRYIIDKNLSADIILLYTNRTVNDILYADIFEKAKSNGVKTIYNLTDVKNAPQDWRGTTGYLTSQTIQERIPDYKKRKYYLSGPQLMVQNFEETLRKTGVAGNQIKTDFFPGYSEK